MRTNKNYIVPHVGGIDETNFIKNQEKVIKKIKHKNNDDTTYCNYDPYSDFLLKHGLSNKQKQEYKTHLVNIDSRNRSKKPEMQIVSSTKLANNPLKFTRGSRKINIMHNNNGLNDNDMVTLTNVKHNVVTVVNIGNIISDVEQINGNVGTLTTETKNGNILEFIDGSNIVKINYSHQLPVKCNYEIINNDVVFKNDPFYDTYDISLLTITIDGFKGNNNIMEGMSHYDNIPISYINTNHNIILKDPENGKIRRNVFYIKLPRVYKKQNNLSGEDIKYTFNIIYNYLCGVPLNYINAEYPIDSEHLNGFHFISDVDTDSYCVKTILMSSGMRNSEGDIETSATCVGGANIISSKINTIKKEYVDPNQYNIQLDKIYSNVVSVKMMSSEFPNSEKIIKDYPDNNANNKVYWQNLDDGDYVYVAEIKSGNYKINELEIELEKAFYGTPRINYNTDNKTNGTSKSLPKYTNHNYIRVNINEMTDIVTFRSYIENFFIKPIIGVEPEIPTDPSFYMTDQLNYKLIIRHDNHNLNVGDEILITNSISHLGIPENVINNEHSIIEIVDENIYKIEIINFNLGATRYQTGGGTSVGIYIPNKIRLLFNKKNTIGTILGFRNVGESIAITSFGKEIKNTDKYAFETEFDEYGNKKIYRNNSIILSGYNYIQMVVDQLQCSNSLNVNKDMFTKILLSDVPGTILFNTFVQTNKIFNEPIAKLSELDISFYSPDGELYNFNGIDHSFTIEITVIDNIKDSISSKTGKYTKLMV